uniref:Endonuclease n=1 Tax=Strigamia maritima TaxID=126957 RepID=T1IL07_STRMM
MCGIIWSSCMSPHPSLAMPGYMRISFSFGGLKEDLDTFIGRIQKAADDMTEIKAVVVDSVKAYMLISRVGPEFENQVQSIYQWASADFTFDKVAESLQAENARLNKSTTNGCSASARTGKSNLNWLTCYNCQQQGHYARDCTNPRMKRDEKAQSAEVVVEAEAGQHVERSPSLKPFILVLFLVLKLSPMDVELGEGTSKIIGIGTVVLNLQAGESRSEVTLNEVYCAPGFKSLIKYNSDCCLMHASLEDGNLYRVLERVTTKPDCIADDGCANSIKMTNQVQNYAVSIELWHQPFSHMYVRGLNHLVKNDSVKGIDLERYAKGLTCDSCKIAKSTRGSFGDDIITANVPLQLLHMDVWGPNKVPSIGGALYLLTIIDDASRYAWTFPMKSKDQAFEVFQKFHVRQERLSGKKIVAIKTDCGGEFCSGKFEKYLEERGIGIQRTNPYSPQMNSVAERVNCSIFDSVRAMRREAKLPKNLWAELSVTAVYLKNRYPHKGIQNQVPYVLWRQRKLSLQHLKRPGCVAFVHIPKQKRQSKLDDRAWRGVMVDYAFGTRGYRIWKLETNEVAETKSVSFDETRCWGNIQRIHQQESEEL